MNDDCTIESVIDAFSDESFNKLINEKRIVIEGILSEFTNDSEKKISRSINSRIKSVDSLKEKLKRKNYIVKWGIKSQDKSELQNIICEKLPDLLGFRINCYFKIDEESVFNELRNFLGNKENIEVEADPDLYQKNGHIIYKIACRYKELKNIFCFEVQVKSLLHDTWGEVEHSLVYKNKQFDSHLNFKKDIIEGLYTVLEGADQQLQKLYTFNFSEIEIKHELFYIYTSNREMHSKHYENFFSLSIFLQDFERDIENFLGKKLLNEDVSKIKISTTSNSNIDIKNVKERIDPYKWQEACKIAAHVYEFADNDEFLKYIITGVMNISDSEEDLEDSFNEDATLEKMDKDENLNNILASLKNFLNEEEDINGKN